MYTRHVEAKGFWPRLHGPMAQGQQGGASIGILTNPRLDTRDIPWNTVAHEVSLDERVVQRRYAVRPAV
jgi:hypothetical protein